MDARLEVERISLLLEIKGAKDEVSSLHSQAGKDKEAMEEDYYKALKAPPPPPPPPPPLPPIMALKGPNSLMIENKTCLVTGPAFTRRETSPRVMVVTPLKPQRIHLVEFTTPKESFICLKVSSCNKFVALLGSTRTLCTSKLLIQR